MRHSLLRSTACLALAVICLMPAPARASFVTSLDTVLTGATPSGSAPWLSAKFEDSDDDNTLAAGTVRLTLTSLLSNGDFLQGSKNALAWLFNLNPDKAAEDLSFSAVSGTLADTIVKDTDGAALNPFSDFDFGFIWKKDKKTGTERFDAGDTTVYLITISGGGLVASDFAAKNGDGYYSGAHVQGIGSKGDSSKIFSDGEDDINILSAPVPPALALLASAAPLLLGCGLLRRRNPAA